MKATVTFMDMTTNPVSAADAEMNFMPAPTTVETLRAMADGVTGGHEAAVFAGILRQAAKELESLRMTSIDECAQVAANAAVEYSRSHQSTEMYAADAVARKIRALKDSK